MSAGVPEARWPGGNIQRARNPGVQRLDQLYIANDAPKAAPASPKERLTEPRWVGGAKNDVSVGFVHEKDVSKTYELYAERDNRKSAAKLMEEAGIPVSERRGASRWPNGNRLDVYDGEPERYVESLMTVDDPIVRPRPGSSRRGKERWIGGARPDRMERKGPPLVPLWTADDKPPADLNTLPSRRGEPRWMAGARPDFMRGQKGPKQEEDTGFSL